MEFDAVCDFIGFVQPHLERDFRLFGGRTKQFVYISSASAYNKLPSDYVITEGTSLASPFLEYCFGNNAKPFAEKLLKALAGS